MSRSYNKTPIIGYTTAPSDKKGKQQANRRFRRKIKVEVLQGKEVFTDHKKTNNCLGYAERWKTFCS